MYYSKINILVLFSLFATLSSFAVAEPNFQGSGNEAGNVNSYITYPELSSSDLEYRLGKKRIFRVSYGSGIDISSFSAVLNGKDISRRFHPEAGDAEHVYLPLRKGINTLRFKISDKGDERNGVVPNWDVDEFSISLKGLQVTPRYLEAPNGFEKVVIPPARMSNTNRPVTIDKSKR